MKKNEPDVRRPSARPTVSVRDAAKLLAERVAAADVARAAGEADNAETIGPAEGRLLRSGG